MSRRHDTGRSRAPSVMPGFRERFEELFEAHHARLVRVMCRISGDPGLAADLAQSAFVRLYRRGALPGDPEAWLISVALNLLRNEKSTRARRLRLVAPLAVTDPPDPPPTVEQASASARERRRVRDALGCLDARARALLLLRAEGYRYHDIAAALDLREASIGTLLARARRAFLAAYGDADAPR